MARSLSAALTAVKNTNQAHTHLLLDLLAGAQLLYFADMTLTFGGNAYLPRLTFEDSLTQHRSLQLDRATVVVENGSLYFTELMKTVTLDGATATLRRLYSEADEAVTIFGGSIASVRIERRRAELVMTSGLDPSARRIPERVYSQLCTWKFKSTECGYTGSEFTVCNKSFADCTARAQTHRFNGFIHLTRDLSEQVPPPPQPEPADPSGEFGDEMDPYYEDMI